MSRPQISIANPASYVKIELVQSQFMVTFGNTTFSHKSFLKNKMLLNLVTTGTTARNAVCEIKLLW